MDLKKSILQKNKNVSVSNLDTDKENPIDSLDKNKNHNNNDNKSNPDNTSQKNIDWSSLYKKEDWWAVWIGLSLFFLSLPALGGTYLLGWIPSAKPWTDITQALSSKIFEPWIGLILSFIFLALIMIPVTKYNGVKSKDWIKGFSIIFFSSWAIWILSNYSPLVKVIGSAEIGYIIALVAGIIITNTINIPKWLKDSARGELFIKIAIVLLGAKILLTTFFTSAPLILTAAFLSFPVVWIAGYFISKKIGLDRDMSATLSSGVGVCGVSASIATAAAIEAPPIYSTVISSIIVIFSAVEIILMPFIATIVFPDQFEAAGVWMGLSVKTDGAATASASVTDGFLGANGTALNVAVITKVLIDIGIGVISFILATIWINRFKRQKNVKASPRLLWYRFPKFVLGYFATSLIISLIALSYPTVEAGSKAVQPVILFGTEPLRIAFFIFTFFAIGLYPILKV